jgi:hypothetical protein
VGTLELESPRSLLSRLKLGREEYCQRLLTMLILDAPYPKWNTASSLSSLGAKFLAALDELSFGAHDRAHPTTFVDEFDLPKRPADVDGGACDYAVLWPNRLWLIELKTEVSSWRADQLPKYFTLGAHHHAARHLDITYLTPPMSHRLTEVPAGTHFAHLVWEQATPLIGAVWANGSPWQQEAVATLSDVLAGIGTPWAITRANHLILGEAIEMAESVAGDGQQRAVEVPAGGLDELYGWCRLVDADLRSGPEGSTLRLVRPWVWSSATSGGVALTEVGATTGFELRLSRYESPA